MVRVRLCPCHFRGADAKKARTKPRTDHLVQVKTRRSIWSWSVSFWSLTTLLGTHDTWWGAMACAFPTAHEPEADQKHKNRPELSGRSNYRFHLDHRYRTNWSRSALFLFCARPVVPAHVFTGRRLEQACAGTTGIAQNLKNPLRDQLVRYRLPR